MDTTRCFAENARFWETDCPYLTVLTSSPQLLLRVESGDGAYADSKKASELTLFVLGVSS